MKEIMCTSRHSCHKEPPHILIASYKKKTAYSIITVSYHYSMGLIIDSINRISSSVRLYFL